MVGRSKYDSFWESIANQLRNAIEKAYVDGLAVIDISEIRSYGQRDSWYDRVVIYDNEVIKEPTATHLKSLSRFIIENDLLKGYDVYFKFTVTKDLKLKVEVIEKAKSQDTKECKFIPGHITSKHFLEEQIHVDCFYKNPKGPQCKCDEIFKDFLWRDLEDIKSTKLPNKPGVYVIRVLERGNDPHEICIKFRKMFKVKWVALREYIDSRLKRLERIEKCPILYCGVATKSIKSRYEDLAGKRHTAFFPVLALLLGGWRLEYGFTIVNTEEQAMRLEEELKRKYIKIHGRLPSLVEK